MRLESCHRTTCNSCTTQNLYKCFVVKIFHLKPKNCDILEKVRTKYAFLVAMSAFLSCSVMAICRKVSGKFSFAEK